MWVKFEENCHVLINQLHRNFHSKTLSCRKIKSVFRDVEWCFNASWGLKGLNCHPLDVVGETCSYLFNLRPNIWKAWCRNANFIPNITVGLSCESAVLLRHLKISPFLYCVYSLLFIHAQQQKQINIGAYNVLFCLYYIGDIIITYYVKYYSYI